MTCLFVIRVIGTRVDNVRCFKHVLGIISLSMNATPLSTSHIALQRRLHGLIGSSITPFDADDEVDLDVLRTNVALMAGWELSAVIASGGLGEFHSMTPAENLAVTEACVEAVGGSIPVIGSTGFGPKIAVQLARDCERAGAATLLVVPPYSPMVSAAGLADYYRAIADSCDLPLILYTRRTGDMFRPEFLSTLLADVPSIVAVMYHTQDIGTFLQARDLVERDHGPARVAWLTSAAEDVATAYAAAGAVGFTSSLSVFWPEAATALYRLLLDGRYMDYEQMRRRVVAPLVDFARETDSAAISVYKAAGDLLGYRCGPPRAPAKSLTADERDRLQELLDALAVPGAATRRVPRRRRPVAHAH